MLTASFSERPDRLTFNALTPRASPKPKSPEWANEAVKSVTKFGNHTLHIPEHLDLKRVIHLTRTVIYRRFVRGVCGARIYNTTYCEDTKTLHVYISGVAE
jgi:hypothetical protein